MASRTKLPRLCECGGRMVYEHDFGRVFSHCATCTPVVTVPIPRNALGEQYQLPSEGGKDG